MVKHHLSRFVLLILFAAMGANLGCTRKIDKVTSLSISVPITKGSGLGSLSANNRQLQIVILNIRSSASADISPLSLSPCGDGGPNGGNDCPAVTVGDVLPIKVVNNVPISSSTFIQFLGVFQDLDSGAYSFAYGDAQVDTTKAGEIPVSITAKTYGAAEKIGRVGGRYVSQYVATPTPHYEGPTGILITNFVPPAGKPAMEVERSEMVNGWFSAMAFDGGGTNPLATEYVVLQDDGSKFTLFANEPGADGPINLRHKIFNGDDATNPGTNGSANSLAAVVDVPASYAVESYGNGPGSSEWRLESAQRFVLGWFIHDSSLNGFLPPKFACVPGSTTLQTIDGLFDVIDRKPLAYDAGTADFSPPSGVTVAKEANVGEQTDGVNGNCQTSLFVNTLTISPDNLRDSHEGAFGFVPPFAKVVQGRPWGGFMDIQVLETTNAPVAINSATRTSNVSTILFPAAHGFTVGQRIFISGNTDNSFNTFTPEGVEILSVPSSTTLTINNSGADVSSGANGGNAVLKDIDVKLVWKYLPESEPGSPGLAGVTVYAKQRSYNSGGFEYGGDDEGSEESEEDMSINCNTEMLSQGFQPLVDQTTVSAMYTVTAPPGYAEFAYAYDSSTPESVYLWEYAICPYRTVSGTKKYFVDGVREGCIGGCDQDARRSYGKKVPSNPGHSFVMASNSNADTLGASDNLQRVTSVSNAVVGDGVTTLTVQTSSFAAGDEVMLIVGSQTNVNGAGVCGSSFGRSNETGKSAFVKVLGASSTFIDIPEGTFLDGMTTLGATLSAVAPGTHCFVQVVKVLEFGNLTLNSGVELSVNSFDPTQSFGAGGFIVLRVNGTLTLDTGSSIHTNYVGMQGVLSSGLGQNGGQVGNYNPPYQGGAGGGNGGSGGSGGFASGSSPTMGGMSNSMGGGTRSLTFAGAGGGDGLLAGGSSGGNILIFTRKISVTGSASVNANGFYGGSGTYSGTGGGAGGNITIVTEGFATGSANLNVNANGGAGGNSGNAAGGAGGGGGAGYISAQACSTTNANFVKTANGGVPGSSGFNAPQSGTSFNFSNIFEDPIQSCPPP